MTNDELQALKQTTQQQGDQLSNQISDLQTKLTKLQGRYELINEILEKQQPAEEAPVAPVQVPVTEEPASE